MGCLLSCCCPIDNDHDDDPVIIPIGNDPHVAVDLNNADPYRFTEECTTCHLMFIKSVPNKCSHCGALSNNIANIRPIPQNPEKQKLDHEIQTDVFGRKTQFAC